MVTRTMPFQISGRILDSSPARRLAVTAGFMLCSISQAQSSSFWMGAVTLSGGVKSPLIYLGIAEAHEPPSTPQAYISPRAFISSDGGATWDRLGGSFSAPSHGDGAKIIPDVWDPNVVYAAFPLGDRPEKSTDAARRWSTIDSGLYGQQAYDLAISPIHRGVLFAGTMNGVYRSDNGGSSWSLFSNGIPPPNASGSIPLSRQVHFVVCDQHKPGTVYAAGGTRFFRSSDNGHSWEDHTPTVPQPDQLLVNSLTVDPYTPNNFFLSVDHFLFHSTDAGDHWTDVVAALWPKVSTYVEGIAIAPDRKTLYAITRGVGSPPGAILKSSDGGSTWGVLRTIPTGTGYVFSPIIIVPNGSLVALFPTKDGENRIPFRSVDGGRSWTRSLRGLPFKVDQNGVTTHDWGATYYPNK